MTAPRETGGEGREALDEVKEAIGALPLPWGSKDLDAPLARVSAALDRLATPRPVEVTPGMMGAASIAAAEELPDGYRVGGLMWEASVARHLTAALRAQPAGGTPTGDAVAWLLTFAVEQVIDGSPPPTWVKGFALVNVRDLGSTHPFATRPTLRPVRTHDRNEAMRFVRKRDAEAALSSLEGTSYAALLKAEEHMWCDRTYPVAAPVADAGGTRSWCEEVNEGRSRCLVQCRACELLENAAAPALPPVGERGDGSWSDERLRSASDEDVLTLMLELRGRFALYRNEAQLEDSERCRREILRRLATRPSPAPSGEPTVEDAWAALDRAVSRDGRFRADAVTRAMGECADALRLAAAPHPDGAA